MRRRGYHKFDKNSTFKYTRWKVHYAIPINQPHSLIWSRVSTAIEWVSCWQKIMFETKNLILEPIPSLWMGSSIRTTYLSSIFSQHENETTTRETRGRSFVVRWFSVVFSCRLLFFKCLHSNLNLRPKQVKFLEGSYNGWDCVAILPKCCDKSMIFHLLPALL